MQAPEKPLVELDTAGVTCRGTDGSVEPIAWGDLRAVLIVTTSGGPFSEDVFWVLVDQDGGCVVPGEAAGVQELIQCLQALPGFDNGAMTQALSSGEDRQFLCWEAPEDRLPT